MKAMDLILRYNGGEITPDHTGVFVCCAEDAANQQEFATTMFGGKIVQGSLQAGKAYIYAYLQADEDIPDGFKASDVVAMTVKDWYGDLIYIYGIEP